MPCPQGVSLRVPPVAAWASSSRIAGRTCNFVFLYNFRVMRDHRPRYSISEEELSSSTSSSASTPGGGVSFEDDQGEPRIVPTAAIYSLGRHWSSWGRSAIRFS